MSLQVQSSQVPSGRRTPQIYQNLSPSTTPPPTNGSTNGSNKPSSTSKLSLKPSSTKQVSAESPNVSTETVSGKESPKPTTLAVNKLAASQSNSPAKVDKKEKEEKPQEAVAANGSNGNHSHKEETNGNHTEKPETSDKIAVEAPKTPAEKDKKAKETSKSSSRSTPQKQPAVLISVEKSKTPEKVVEKLKEPDVHTPVQKKKETVAVNTTLDAEKPLKGFTTEGDEMESLVVEPSEYEDSPMPPRTGGKTKLLKYGAGPPTRARVSPFRINEITGNAVTAVNLSTVSEGQTSAPESNEASPTQDFNRPLRSISGRRTTRPITDIQFTYRRSMENESISSMNVTVGSEIHNDSLRTPAPGTSRKRKAVSPESTSDVLDVKEICESPKRGRLDFSGFLEIVASPVTMLKNRLSRVRLLASTPVPKRSLDDEELGTCITAEATTTTNISGDNAKMDVEEEEEKKVEDVPGESGDQQTMEKTKEDQTKLPEGMPKEEELPPSADLLEPVEVKYVTNDKPWCMIM